MSKKRDRKTTDKKVSKKRKLETHEIVWDFKKLEELWNNNELIGLLNKINEEIEEIEQRQKEIHKKTSELLVRKRLLERTKSLEDKFTDEQIHNYDINLHLRCELPMFCKKCKKLVCYSIDCKEPHRLH